jgi:hypothetical protein
MYSFSRGTQSRLIANISITLYYYINTTPVSFFIMFEDHVFTGNNWYNAIFVTFDYME